VGIVGAGIYLASNSVVLLIVRPLYVDTGFEYALLAPLLTTLVGLPFLYAALSRAIDPTMDVRGRRAQAAVQAAVAGTEPWQTTLKSLTVGMASRGVLVSLGFCAALWFLGLFAAIVPLLLASPVEECQAGEEKGYIPFHPCRIACEEEDDALGCRQISRALAENAGIGNDVGRDFDRSLDFARRACELSDEYCRSLRYHECLADPEVCRLRCLQDDADSCFWLSKQYYFTHHRVDYDPDQGYRYDLRACLLGRKSSCLNTPDLVCNDGIATCDRRCRDGSAVHCGWLSVIFRDGHGDTLADPERRWEYEGLACEYDREIMPSCGPNVP